MTDEEVLKGIAHDIAKEYAARAGVERGFDLNHFALDYWKAYQAAFAQLRELLPPEFVQNFPFHP